MVLSPLIESNPSLEALQLTNVTNDLFTMVIIYNVQFEATYSFRLM
jgi:hypothetical protein